MFPPVLPLRALLSQMLILWLAIAIESWFFQQLLDLKPRISVEYAATINLFSTCIGWLLFFAWFPFSSLEERELLIRFIFLGQWNPISLALIVLSLVIFFVSLLGKWQALALLYFLQYGPQQKRPISIQVPKATTLLRGRVKFPQVSRQVGAILIAHTCSHFIILLVLYLENS